MTAVDVSAVAPRYASQNAERNGQGSRILFERHDLARTFPAGAFDLVTASFLHSPQDWPRAAVLSRAAEAVVPGGRILIVKHASRASWSWADPETRYPAAEDTLAAMALREGEWHRLCVSAIARTATGPDGDTAEVTDNVIFLLRTD